MFWENVTEHCRHLPSFIWGLLGYTSCWTMQSWWAVTISTVLNLYSKQNTYKLLGIFLIQCHPDDIHFPMKKDGQSKNCTQDSFLLIVDAWKNKKSKKKRRLNCCLTTMIAKIHNQVNFLGWPVMSVSSHSHWKRWVTGQRNEPEHRRQMQQERHSCYWHQQLVCFFFFPRWLLASIDDFISIVRNRMIKRSNFSLEGSKH